MLVYFLANSKGKLINCDLNFNGEFRFHYNEVNKSLEIKRNENYLKDYWGNNIKSLTTIAGNNGVGKTSILELIKDRFLWGFNHPEKTILITKKNNRFEIYYDQDLFNEDNKIDINGITYNIETSLFNEKANTTVIEILELNLELNVKKITSIDKSKDKVTLQLNTRLGNERSIIFYTNHWNYTRRNRIFKENVDTKGLDYIDYSIGYKIDSIINKSKKYESRISDVGDIYDKVKDTRFEVDYLFKLKEEEMVNTLRYLKDSDGYDIINESLTIPEEIYIYYDFLDSKERGNIFSLDDSKYLRFEHTEENSLLENTIYNYLLKNKTSLNMNESMILALVERLFTDLNLMLFMTEMKEKIKKIDSKNTYNISSIEEIYDLIFDYKHIVYHVIESTVITEVYKEADRDSLKKKVNALIVTYTLFMNYLNTEFFEKVDGYKTETSIFEVNKKGEATRRIEIEVPIIKLNKSNSEAAYNFFVEYSKLISRNKPLYFVWRDLSAGEIQLLNLFTSLNTAIEDAKNKDIIILLDEVEISLHPMLQKKFIKMLVHILNTTAQRQQDPKYIQVILTTHSPFVLSELPFNSLILLEKDYENKVVVQNELENLTATLGANVHELFSHSFFLTGGLIGDYAKDKINEVANNLLGIQSNLGKDYIKRFINQIGEPIIKTRLLELYEQKWTLDKPSEIRSIKDEIEVLKRKLTALEEKGD